MAVNWGEFEISRQPGGGWKLAMSGQIVALLVALALGFPLAAAVATTAGLPAPDFIESAVADPGSESPSATRPDDQGDEHGQGKGTGTERGGPDGQGTGRGNGDPSTTTTSTSDPTSSSSTTSTPTVTTNSGPTTTQVVVPPVTGTTFVWPPVITPTTMPCTCEP